MHNCFLLPPVYPQLMNEKEKGAGEKGMEVVVVVVGEEEEEEEEEEERRMLA